MKTVKSLASFKKRTATYTVFRRGRCFVLPVNKAEKKFKVRQA
ncbi:MAG: hypothetical protein AAFO15_01670 [Pseudomonadota bacterium]